MEGSMILVCGASYIALPLSLKTPYCGAANSMPHRNKRLSHQESPSSLPAVIMGSRAGLSGLPRTRRSIWHPFFCSVSHLNLPQVRVSD